MRRRPPWILDALQMLCVLCLTACVPQPPEPAPDLLNVYATSAAYPWLSDAFACAPASVSLAVSNPSAADLSLRLGEPTVITGPVFRIGADDILVVVHPQTGVAALTLGQARRLFAGEVTNWKDVGGSDLAVQVWAFSSTEDVQVIVDHLILQGRPVASLARLAVSAQVMSDSVGSYPGSIGVLPRRWKAGNTRQVLSLASVPVLALVKAEPQGSLREILGCLQSAH